MPSIILVADNAGSLVDDLVPHLLNKDGCLWFMYCELRISPTTTSRNYLVGDDLIWMFFTAMLSFIDLRVALSQIWFNCIRI